MPDTDNIYNLGYTGDKVKEAIEKALAIDNNPGSEDVYTKSEIDSKLDQKQNALTFDNTPTSGSNNPVTSSGIKSALDTKANIDDVESDFQEKLTFDTTPTQGSNNPVTSGGIKTALDTKADMGDVYTKEEADSQINSKLSNVYKIKGSLSKAQLNYMGRNVSGFTHPDIGDVYNTTEAGDIGSIFSFEELGIEPVSIGFTSANTIVMTFSDGGSAINANSYFSLGKFTCVILEDYPFNDYEIDSTQTDSFEKTLTIILKESVSNYSSAVPVGASQVISVEAGDNIVWTDIGWDKLAATVDLSNYQEKLTFDNTPTEDSENPVTSGGIKAALDEKVNAKIPTNGGATSVNGGSVFVSIYSIGVGDLASLYFGSKVGEPETGADSLEVPSYGLITALLGEKQDTLTFDSAPTQDSTNPVTSGGIKSALDVKANSSDVYTKSEIDTMIGDIEDAADGIIALQESYIGGNGA